MANFDIGVVRYSADGHPVAAFDSDGVVTTDIAGRSNGANAVAVQPDGKIVAVGATDKGVGLARYLPGGGLDPTFGGAGYGPNGKRNLAFGQLGVADTDLSGGFDSGDDLVVDAAGRIVVVGRATSATVTDMALVRYKPDGTLDAGFDGDGVLTADFHGTGDFGHDLAVDSAGRIVAAGTTGEQFALMRVNP